MKKRMKIGMILCAALVAVIVSAMPAFAQAPKGEPIVIGYVGFILSPGTRPCMDIQRVAVEQINKEGGILGRPVKYVVMDGKGDTSLSVEAARKLLVEDGASFVSVEGRTEICLAVQENNAAMVKEYPHILVFNGPMGAELTARVLDEAPKYDFCFRDWDPEPAHYAQTNYFMGSTWPRMFPGGVKKMAFLWEDLAWTGQWRDGIDYLNLPTWENLAKQNGIDVVYSKAVKPRGTMYLPLLQQIALKKPDIIFYISSWFTDTESYTKQWAESAARNTLTCLYGGVAQTHDFWKMTGGKAMGIISSFTEMDIPLTEKSLPFVALGKELNIPLQIHVHIAYADIFHFKAAIERAGGIDDLGKLIKAMEDVETVYSLGKMKYETKKVKPFYHSRVRVDPNDPLNTTYSGYFYQPIVQFQEGGKIAYLGGSCKENEEFFKPYGKLEDCVAPSELRKRQ